MRRRATGTAGTRAAVACPLLRFSLSRPLLAACYVSGAARPCGEGSGRGREATGVRSGRMGLLARSLVR
jgi:hypothetical protein